LSESCLPEANNNQPTKGNMKTKMNTNLLSRCSLALALALTVWSPLPSQAAEPVEGKMKMDGKMGKSCQAMMDQKQKMVADMKAQDAKLAEQVAQMNSAPADKKLGLTSAIVTHMVEQQTAMHARKAKMDDEMMKHMMQHMQMNKDSMSQCPMMKRMKDMSEKSGDAPKEQK